MAPTGRPPSWSRTNHLLRPMTPLPSSFKHCPGCEITVAADDPEAQPDGHGRRWHGACLNPPKPQACTLCLNTSAVGGELREDTEGRRWHARCVAPFAAHVTINGQGGEL